MTGVTRFGVSADNNVPTRHNFAGDGDLVLAGHSDGSDNSPAAWLTLDKTENEAELAVPDFWLRFDYLLMENERAVTGGSWDTVAVVEGYAGIEVLKPGVEPGEGELTGVRRVGRGAQLTVLRDRARALTGGWWVGPRLSPKIRIMKRRGAAAAADRATETAAKAA